MAAAGEETSVQRLCLPAESAAPAESVEESSDHKDVDYESDECSEIPSNDDSPLENPQVSMAGVETTVTSAKDLPKNGTCVNFKDPSGTDWRTCEVLSRGGKAKCGNWHFLNIKEGTDEKCVSFKDTTWKDIQPTDEVLLLDSDLNDKEKFETAKIQELEKWKQMNVYKEVPNTGQSTISTRWVLTKKVSKDGVCHKARLVARGFEEETPPRTDSPTC